MNGTTLINPIEGLVDKWGKLNTKNTPHKMVTITNTNQKAKASSKLSKI
jgi:hypothetical protein